MYVEGGTGASTNFNAATTNPNLELKVQKNSDISQSRKTYLRFDLANAPADIEQVDLLLDVRIDNAVRVSVYGLNDGIPSDAASGSGGWSETAMTWNTAPANDVTSRDGILPDATLLGSFDMIDTPDHSSGPYFFSSADNIGLLDFIIDDSNERVTFILTGSDSIGGKPRFRRGASVGSPPLCWDLMLKDC